MATDRGFDEGHTNLWGKRPALFTITSLLPLTEYWNICQWHHSFSAWETSRRPWWDSTASLLEMPRTPTAPAASCSTTPARCVCVSVCLSPSLHVCLSVCLSVSLCLSVYLPISLSLSDCLSVCLSVCLPLSMSVCLSVYLSLCLSVWLSLSLSLSDCLSVCLSACLSSMPLICSLVTVATGDVTSRHADNCGLPARAQQASYICPGGRLHPLTTPIHRLQEQLQTSIISRVLSQ